MKNSTVYEIIGALLLYGVFFVAIWVFRDQVDPVLLGTGIDPGGENANVLVRLLDNFQLYGSIVLGVSLVCFLIWYAMAASAIRPTAPNSTYLLVWFLLFVVILASAGIVYWVSTGQLDAISKDYLPEYVAGFYFGAGLLLYYAASVFFSPLHARYRIPPAKYVRR